MATLEEAVALMAAGGKDNPNLSGMMKAVRDRGLTERDQKDLVEFLKALSGEYPIDEQSELPQMLSFPVPFHQQAARILRAGISAVAHQTVCPWCQGPEVLPPPSGWRNAALAIWFLDKGRAT